MVDNMDAVKKCIWTEIIADINVSTTDGYFVCFALLLSDYFEDLGAWNRLYNTEMNINGVSDIWGSCNRIQKRFSIVWVTSAIKTFKHSRLCIRQINYLLVSWSQTKWESILWPLNHAWVNICKICIVTNCFPIKNHEKSIFKFPSQLCCWYIKCKCNCQWENL